MAKFKYHTEITSYIFDVIPDLGCKDDLIAHTFRQKNDWTFIISYHAALESLINMVLIKKLIIPEKTALRLPIQGKRSKMSNIISEKALPDTVCDMIKCFSCLRNHLIHNLNMLSVNIKSSTDDVVRQCIENIYTIYSTKFVSNYNYDLYKFKKHFYHEMQVLLMMLVEITGITIINDAELLKNYLECFYDGYYWKKDWLSGWTI